MKIIATYIRFIPSYPNGYYIKVHKTNNDKYFKEVSSGSLQKLDEDDIKNFEEELKKELLNS